MLELFKFDACPYCRKVMNYIEQSGRKDIVFRDIRKEENSRQRLISTGGKEQVPCLFIHGTPLYESLDIISWLQEHPENSVGCGQ